MHPTRKFSQNLCKNKTLSIQSALNKENEKSSMTESFAKKFSIGNHVVSDESEYLKHKRSIADEKISVFLDPSQNRVGFFEKPNNENEARYLNRVLQTQEGTVTQILSRQLEKCHLKNEDLKKLVCTLVQKLQDEQQKSEGESQNSFVLSNNIMRPYLEQQILLLQKNLRKLKSQEQDLTILQVMNQTQKKFLLKNLIELESSQRGELTQLR